MSLNPYAGFLGQRDPIVCAAETPARLKALVERLGAAGLERSIAPGKWTVRQILGHLADAEIAFAFRFRQTLAEPSHVIQPFDQDLWAQASGSFSAAQALEVFTALRNWNLTLLRSAPAKSFSKPVTHPERGVMTLGTIVETMAGHDLNHLQQVEKIAAQAA
jgi:uncharacterized damage-inducible protein DinB